ncbi:DUF3025 domain-containing protein [Alteromonas oceani]|uniref:DUF3025 domain-containing protein n=1 Tax=Alteromonas oceani TaxID=2071609 RepID=A0ABV7JX44_9ALTE|nr:DUF3025 domain-containing protein [Alteromonas oceani]
MPLDTLFSTFRMEGRNALSAPQLNDCAKLMDEGWAGPDFIDDDQADLANRYYEVFIAEENQVPTRTNWHDTFNAMMWIAFPRTKKRINTLHCEEIAQFGVHPRTPKRNRITHFDECGLVIAVPQDKLEKGNQLLERLANHQWQECLVDNQHEWGNTLFPVIIGHALYEMLLDPFIGLTAKWLAVIVPEGFEKMDEKTRYKVIDAALAERLTELDGLAAKNTLKPIPLLGIPGWYSEQTEAFYADTGYFRPLAPNAPATVQLPLCRT